MAVLILISQKRLRIFNLFSFTISIPIDSLNQIVNTSHK